MRDAQAEQASIVPLGEAFLFFIAKNNQISISHSKGIVFFRVFLCTQAHLTASSIRILANISISSPIGSDFILWYNYFVVTIYEKYWRFSYGYY